MFIAQSTPDIRKKLPKIDFTPDSSFDSLVKIASFAFYNQDWDKTKNRKQRGQKNVAFIVASNTQTLSLMF